MAVKAVNNSIEPEGLVPTLSVFGSHPRLGIQTDAIALSTSKRAAQLKESYYCYVQKICIETSTKSSENQKRA